MKKTVYSQLLILYLLIGIASFFLVSAGGSYLVEKNLEHTLSESLYQEANSIASYDTVKHNISTSSLSAVKDTLMAIAIFQNADIWIINSQNEVIVNTDKTAPATPVLLENFDPTAWGGSYYQTGDFYGYFKTPRLSVIAPITSDMTTKGYIAVHYQMKSLYQQRSKILSVMQLIFFIVYALTFVLLLFYRAKVHKPIQLIIKATSEYDNGNLAYRIPIKSDNELGYLANTLNYMANTMNQNGEYQRKFISNVSHDFRSPLTSIKGYVTAMLDGTIPPELQEKYLKIIAYESERLEKLTNSLLALNELDVKKRLMQVERFDINEIIKTTANTFEGICTDRKIRLELILSGRELFVMADMTQIQQVLYNLLDNAIKFSDNASSIILETTEKNGKVFVSVKDNGCGIPKESLSKVWERFYKTDASRGRDRKGTGLGLAIVKEIINAHDQNINVISTEGVGTEFIFTLEKAK